jgi:hypothetical protein
VRADAPLDVVVVVVRRRRRREGADIAVEVPAGRGAPGVLGWDGDGDGQRRGEARGVVVHESVAVGGGGGGSTEHGLWTWEKPWDYEPSSQL